MGAILPGGLIAPGALAAAPGVLPGVLPGALAPAGGAPDLSLVPGVLGPASPIPTPCLLLKGMFTAATQAEPDWEAELREDVADEAAKFGPLLHMHVDAASQVRVWAACGRVRCACRVCWSCGAW
jgi:RNA-binding protein 39